MDLTPENIFSTLNRKVINFAGSTGFAAQEKIKTFPRWQYTGVAPFNEVLQWCEDNIGDDYIWNWETIYFKVG